ncbi:MAG: HAD-IIIC family phosphatase [Synergistaceae bacterium]|jgi:FkbH-like protein|nr:HAD-IIIC family phosphatase [Synergistaceae bacterium]
MSKTIALLSNVTVESLALRIAKESEDLKTLNLKVFTSPGFDAWRTALLDPSSELWRDHIKTIYVILHGPALFPDGVGARFAETLAESSNILSRAQAEHKDKILVVSTLDLPSSPARPFAGRNFSIQASAYWQGELEKLDIPVLDLAELAAETGRERFYSPKTWYFGSLPFSRQGELLLAREVLRVEKAVGGDRKKCLVLDLDNTLWGGVVGEDGIEGIGLAPSGMGSQYRDVQRVAKELSEQGVLLAIASKNNLEDALRPFREHPHMLLKEEDFVKIKADWSPKSANIQAIARELSIGLDSLVFVDDNPLEREAVKSALPEVAVPDFPDGDTSQLPAFMKQVARTYFTALRLGEEDREKTEMYHAESRREEERKVHLSLDDYLASLEMKLDLHRLREDEVPRAAQLTQKTNQFNLTTRRYTEADMAAMVNDGSARVWMAALADRFGDYGRTCLLIAHLDAPKEISDATHELAATIDTFLMSCRVMGRGVEDAVLGCVERSLADEGVTAIRGEYRETNKNEPVREFWDKMGYELETEVPGGSVWILRAPFNERRTKICLSC